MGRGDSRRHGASPEFDGLSDDAREAARKRLERRRAARAKGPGEAPAASRSSGRPPRRADADRPAVGRFDLLGTSLSPSPSRLSRGGRAGRPSTLSSLLALAGQVPRPLLIAAAALALIVAIAAAGAIGRSCAGPAQEPVVRVEEGGQEGEGAEASAPEQADAANLPAGLDADIADALMERAREDERVAHIVNNASALAADGETEQLKLLKLAAEEPEAADFVAAMPESYPAEAGEPYDEPLTPGEVPLLMQWDKRWGYTRYCGLSFASAGCCPTSLSMVYMGLTGKADLTPYDMGVLATQGGYAVDHEGTVGDFLVDIAPGIGLQCERFAPSASSLLTYLESGYVVICNVGPGDFTSSGHFFVIVGIADDGTLEICDPYSAVRSAKTWDADSVAGQSIAMYAFRA